MSADDPRLRRLDVAQLNDRYADAIDNDRLEEWAELFVEDCLYEIIPRENHEAGLPAPLIRCDNKRMLRDRVVSLRKANIYERPGYRHMFSGLVITADEGQAIEYRMNYMVINTSQAGDSVVYQSGRYEDRIELTEGGWRFVTKRAIYDTSRVQTLLALPV